MFCKDEDDDEEVTGDEYIYIALDVFISKERIPFGLLHCFFVESFFFQNSLRCFGSLCLIVKLLH